jgi:hypothetical protein
MTDRPEDVDAAFAEIVADLEREGVGRGVGKQPDDQPEESGPPDAQGRPDSQGRPDARGRPAPADPESTWRGHGTEWDWSWGTDDEHYVPPEPPPLPRLRPITITALVLLVAGMVLLIGPGIFGLDTRFATPIGLIALASGGCLLLLRIRRAPPPDLDRDDGAQV